MSGSDPRFRPEGAVTRAVARAVGRRQLRRLVASGLPATLVEPLSFLVERSVPSGDYGPVDRIEGLRAAMAATPAAVGRFRVPGARASTRADEATPVERPLAEVAGVSSVPALWGVFLHLCARATGARTILELGAAAGISGSYLATSPSCRRFVTVEGDAGRAALARRHITSLNPAAEVVNRPFDTALEQLVPRFDAGIDLVFVDGNKLAGGYVALVERFETRLNPGALMIFDDIQWTAMAGDWQHLCARPGISHAISAGRFGVCVWQGGAARPRVSALFGVAGWDLYALRRDLLART
jgi:predicted O-methyltransferase YrrM